MLLAAKQTFRRNQAASAMHASSFALSDSSLPLVG
jgi:hypothetical protein